jgi:hypothetical protein
MEQEETNKIIKQILQRFGDQARFLDPGSNPREALPVLDAADKLVDQLSGEVRSTLNCFADMFREQALAFAEQKEGADIESIQQHFQSALDHIRRAREEYPDTAEVFESLLNQTRTNLELQIRNLESLATRPPDESPADAQARRRRLIEDAIDALPRDDPSNQFLKGLLDFNDAMGLFRESANALSWMNLEDASRHIGKASTLLHHSEETWKGDQSPYLRVMRPIGMGFRMLIDAQRTFVQTLRDAVVGDVTNRHVAALTVADDELMEGLKQIETWGPRMVEFLPQASEGFNIPELRSTVNNQRKVLHSFKSLVYQGTQAKQVLLRATPRFLAYFVISFLVVLFGSKWSAIVPALDVTVAAGISLTVSVFSAYGFDAGRQVLSNLWPGQKSKGSDTESAESRSA